jgi:hypothetical protein
MTLSEFSSSLSVSLVLAHQARWGADARSNDSLARSCGDRALDNPSAGSVHAALRSGIGDTGRSPLNSRQQPVEEGASGDDERRRPFIGFDYSPGRKPETTELMGKYEIPMAEIGGSPRIKAEAMA